MTSHPNLSDQICSPPFANMEPGDGAVSPNFTKKTGENVSNINSWMVVLNSNIFSLKKKHWVEPMTFFSGQFDHQDIIGEDEEEIAKNVFA